MSAPVRWLESGEAPPGAEVMLRATAPASMPPDTHARLLAHASRVAATPGSGAIAAMLASKAAVALAVGTVVVAGGIALTGAPRKPPPPQLPRSVATAPARAKPATPPPPPATHGDIVSVESLPQEPTPHRVHAAAEPSGADATAVADPLRAGTTAVDAMERALSRDDASGAVRIARGYDRQFPDGQLRSTVDVLATRALEELGRAQAARDVAAGIVARDPSSVHAAEARRVMDDVNR